MYQALYRKYRPRTFSDVTGQDSVTDTLKAQLASGKLAHAYLFTGTRGTGKTTCAKILAKAANCEHPVGGEPCNECPTCKGIGAGSVLDVTEMDAASNRRIEDVRSLLEESNYLPAQAKKRVYIVDEVHMLTREAFNALLKTLEEPPEHLLFILATTDPQKIPATILSRCQRFSFRRIPRELIAERLIKISEQESINLTPDAAAFIARLADGAMRDALSLLERCQGEPLIDRDAAMKILGHAGGTAITEIYRRAVGGDAVGAITRLNELYSDGTDVVLVLEMLGDYVRDSMIISLAPNAGTDLLSGMFDSGELQRGDSSALLGTAQKLQAALKDLDRAPNRKTAAELALISLGTESAVSVPLSSVGVSFVRPPVMSPINVVAPQLTPQPAAPPVTDTHSLHTTAPAAPKAAEAVSAKPSPFTWEQLMKELTLVPALTRELKSGRDVTAEITSDTVTLYVSHPFIEGQLVLPTTISEFKTAAQKLSGREYKIVVLNGSAPKTFSALPVQTNPPPEEPPRQPEQYESPPFPVEDTHVADTPGSLDDLAARFGNIISFEEE
ncbi:MAG: DNA polymerase III subunit gamma/tau [Oscillospiraceae bacterium]|jgi:DNA polymerase-3 subunit gamma/tau|nr:DNA polymerase III subunit gamma/tau [Oscillospiraceae bacterium]